MKRPCIVCGRLTDGSYCREHDPDTGRRRVTPGRTTAAQRAFREAVLRNAQGRCQWVEDGRRCQVTEHLHAHHMSLLRDSGSFDPADGVALCRTHHAQADRFLQGKHPAHEQYGFPCSGADAA